MSELKGVYKVYSGRELDIYSKIKMLEEKVYLLELLSEDGFYSELKTNYLLYKRLSNVYKTLLMKMGFNWKIIDFWLKVGIIMHEVIIAKYATEYIAVSSDIVKDVYSVFMQVLEHVIDNLLQNDRILVKNFSYNKKTLDKIRGIIEKNLNSIDLSCIEDDGNMVFLGYTIYNVLEDKALGETPEHVRCFIRKTFSEILAVINGSKS